MLFLSLILYLIILIPYFLFIIPVIDIASFYLWISIPTIFLIVFGFVWLLMYLVDSFSPEKKYIFLNSLRILGIRWMTFITFLTALCFLFIFSVIDQLNFTIISVLFPIMIVSFANFFNIEIIPKFLKEQEDSGKIVTLREPTIPEIPEDIVKEFNWEHNGKEYSLKLVIRNSIYSEFKSNPRIPLDQNWMKKYTEEYVINGICGEIRELAHQLLLVGKPYGTYEEVSFVLSFVQNVIKYQREEEEYPKYPVETLVEQTGDCEDFTFLGAILLRIMGYDVAVLSPPGHAALGIAGAEGIPGTFIEHNDKRYYYCEMTADGWKIGDIPDEYKSTEICVYPVPPFSVKIDIPAGLD